MLSKRQVEFCNKATRIVREYPFVGFLAITSAKCGMLFPSLLWHETQPNHYSGFMSFLARSYE